MNVLKRRRFLRGMSASATSYLAGTLGTTLFLNGCSNQPSKNKSLTYFGAQDGKDCTKAIQLAAAFSNDTHDSVEIGIGRFLYDGPEITQDFVHFVGRAAPLASTDRTKLLTGSVIVNTLTFRGDHIELENLGVDHGAATFGDAYADALFLGHRSASGKRVRLTNCIGLSNRTGHGIGVEGYDLADLNSISGLEAFHGVALKLKRGFVQNVRAIGNRNTGVVIRSNFEAGLVSDLQINGIYVEGIGNMSSIHGGSDYGVYAVADSPIRRLILNGIQVKNVEIGISARPNADIGELIVSNVNTEKTRMGGLNLQASTGHLQSFVADNHIHRGCDGWAAYIASGDRVQINNFQGLAAAGSTYTAELIRIETTAGKTELNNIHLTADVDSNVIGGIKYLNKPEDNALGIHHASTIGTGTPS